MPTELADLSSTDFVKLEANDANTTRSMDIEDIGTVRHQMLHGKPSHIMNPHKGGVR